MSRVIPRNERVTASSPALNIVEQPKSYHFLEPPLQILNLFTKQKVRTFESQFVSKCRALSKLNQKRYAIIGSILSRIGMKYRRSQKVQALKKLGQNRNHQIKSQIQQSIRMKESTKKASATLLFVQLGKIKKKQVLNALQSISTFSKLAEKYRKIRNAYSARLLQTLYNNKIEYAYLKIKKSKQLYKKRKFSLVKIGKIIQEKRKNNLSNFFNRSKIALRVNEATMGNSNEKSKKISPVKVNTKKVDNINNEKSDESEIRALEKKNERILQDMKLIRNQSKNRIEKYQQQIQKQEGQYQSLRFNNGILQQSIKDLESEMIQKQRKIVKKILPYSQIWEKVYSNFLYFLRQNSGKILNKEQVFSYLESPLADCPINIETIQAENASLSELLQEYKKFYEGQQLPYLNQEELLPYEIAAAKNKCLYSVADSLIKHGVGTQQQVRQLVAELQNITKEM